MKRTAIIAFVLLLTASLVASGCGQGTKEPSTDLDKISEFEGGRLYKAGKIYVCRLNGSYEEMGRQYGGLMKTQIRKFHDEAMAAVKANTKLPAEALEEIPEQMYERYPARIKSVFAGMAKTSGLDLAGLMFCDCVETVAMVGELSQAQCSAVVAWGPYTGGGPLVFGRNFDYPEYFKEFDDTLTVVVFNPDDGSRSTATLVNAGQVRTLNSFNDTGLMLEINDGLGSGDMSSPENRVPTLVEALTFLLDATNYLTLDAELSSTRPYHPFIITVSDSKEAFTYETTTTDVKRRGGSDGLLVATNHFMNPEWNIQPEQQPAWLQQFIAFSTLRSDNLTALAEANKGGINADTMKKIMDTGVEQGGATHAGTIYQFVAEPSEREMWVQALGFQDWTLIEYGKLFD